MSTRGAFLDMKSNSAGRSEAGSRAMHSRPRLTRLGACWRACAEELPAEWQEPDALQPLAGERVHMQEKSAIARHIARKGNGAAVAEAAIDGANRAARDRDNGDMPDAALFAGNLHARGMRAGHADDSIHGSVSRLRMGHREFEEMRTSSGRGWMRTCFPKMVVNSLGGRTTSITAAQSLTRKTLHGSPSN